MDKKDEALLLALEVIDGFDPWDDFANLWEKTADVDIDEAVNAIREALAQPDQEPILSVDWSRKENQAHALQKIGSYWYDGTVRNEYVADTCHELAKIIAAMKENTAPPVASQTVMRDLTEEEILAVIQNRDRNVVFDDIKFARAIIAAMKEKK